MFSLSILSILKDLNIPICLRICAGTDGSITRLLEILTGKEIEIVTHDQSVMPADSKIAHILDIEIGNEVNHRTVTICSNNVVYVWAKSLSPLERMPAGMRQELMHADIPIGKILRNYKLETRRDIEEIKILSPYEAPITPSNLFGDIALLSRIYNIIHNNQILFQINEVFPIDKRWLF